MLLRLILGIVGFFLVVGIVIVLSAGPLLVFAVNHGCGDCDLSFQSSSLRFFPTRFVATGVHFRQGEERYTAIVANIDSLVVPFSLSSALVGKVRVGEVGTRGLRFEVIEGEGHREKTAGGGPPDILIQGVKLEDADFEYRHIYPDKTAKISVHKINGSAGAMGTWGEQRITRTPAHVTAVLEESGAVDLTVNAAYFAPEPDVQVILAIKEQKLAELNRYFTASDGIKLTGILKHAHGEVSLLGDKISSKVEVVYTGFDATFFSGRTRGGFLAFLTNLFRGFKIDDGNLKEKPKDQRQAFNGKRSPRESVVSALLRGLREAAMQIATR